MVKKPQETNISDLLSPSLQKVIDNQLEKKENNLNKLEPIYFDPNVLCCPYCGDTKPYKG